MNFSNKKHLYESLDQSPTIREEGIEYLELEKRSRDQALNICQVFLQAATRFTLIEQLHNIGGAIWVTYLSSTGNFRKFEYPQARVGKTFAHPENPRKR